MTFTLGNDGKWTTGKLREVAEWQVKVDRQYLITLQKEAAAEQKRQEEARQAADLERRRNAPPSPEDFEMTAAAGGVSVVKYKGISRNVVIPSEYQGLPVVNIWQNAFANMPIISVTIPNTVKLIAYDAFYKSTLWNVFRDNAELASVVFQSGCKLTTIEMAMFMACPKLKSIEIPPSVTKIQYKAFDGCAGLTEVTFRGNNLNIREDAFNDCTNLVTVNIPPGARYNFHVNAFKGCKKVSPASQAALRQAGFGGLF